MDGHSINRRRSVSSFCEFDPGQRDNNVDVQAEPANALPWIVYQYVPSHTLGTFPYGEAIVEVVPGQTVTTVFDVPSKGRIYCAPAPRFGEPFVLTYQVEDVLWGRG